jgi:endonuclease/exonuclease/phosphatase (EEP) superfamily protein YafD
MRHLTRFVATSAVAVALFTTIVSLVSLLFPDWWITELLSHLRPFYVFVLVCCLPIVMLRYRRIGWLILLPFALNIAPILPLYQPRQSLPQGNKWSVLHYNLDLTASDHKSVFAYLRDQAPDILLLQEVTPELEHLFRSELPNYRIAFSYPLTNTQGSALLLPYNSPIQVRDAHVVYLPTYSPRPMLTATLALGGQDMILLSMQTTRPRNADTSAFQQIEFEAIAAWSSLQQEKNHALLLIGDINTTPWSTRFQRLLAAGNLHDSGVGYGLQPTWPASLPPLLGIPIDHCLMNARVKTVGREIGPALGGDHRPLLIQFSFLP